MFVHTACRYGDWNVWLSEYQAYCAMFDTYRDAMKRWQCLMVGDRHLHASQVLISSSHAVCFVLMFFTDSAASCRPLNFNLSESFLFVA